MKKDVAETVARIRPSAGPKRLSARRNRTRIVSAHAMRFAETNETNPRCCGSAATSSSRVNCNPACGVPAQLDAVTCRLPPRGGVSTPMQGAIRATDVQRQNAVYRIRVAIKTALLMRCIAVFLVMAAIVHVMTSYDALAEIGLPADLLTPAVASATSPLGAQGHHHRLTPASGRMDNSRE